MAFAAERTDLGRDGHQSVGRGLVGDVVELGAWSRRCTSLRAIRSSSS
jgi:hypothetical protein